MLDYEGELTIIMGHDAKDVSEGDALNYVLGYTMGNDLSTRNFQSTENSGGQACFAKSFDGFGPIGPAIISSRLVSDPQMMHYVLKVNGEVRQDIETSDMIWSVRQIIAHLSLGRTIRAGTAVMTSTAGGVAWYSGRFLRDGDVVEIDCDGLGKMANKIVFD